MFNLKRFNNRSGKALHRMVRGFTLVELLIVVAVVGVLSVGVLTAINVVSNINKATIARAKTFAASVENDIAISQVGKWSFEEGSGTVAKDTSGYGNNGTLTNGPTWQTPSQCGVGLGGCLSFNGVNAYVDSGSIWTSDVTGFSFSLWFKRGDINKEEGIIGKYVSGAFGAFYLVTQSGTDKLNFFLGNGNAVDSVSIQSKKVMNDTVSWHHVAGTFKAKTFVRLYIDGALDNEQTSIVNTDKMFATVGASLKIGDNTNGASTNYFNGAIDEVAIYNQALFSSQIQQLYAQGLPRHLLAKW